jgi:hypothetical protein
MPFKANADRRHRIPKQRRRITNWAEYDAALRQRGSLTVWFTEAAIAAWHAEPRTTPGGQPHYSSLARNRLEVGGQAAMVAGGCGSLAAWKRCPRPMPSVPL